MKAITHNKFGPPKEVLKIEEVKKPSPKDDEVLVKVQANSITYSNMMLVTGKPRIARFVGMGLFKPSNEIPGSDIAGTIEAVGENIKKFKPGDEVYGDLSGDGRSCLAEYVCAPGSALAQKPSNLSFEEASAVPEAALVALQALRDHGKIKSGMNVLINGASGGIGTFAVQIAKYYGAKVTGVCSTKNLDLVRSIGADHVIDYTKESITQNGEQYDIILGTAGFQTLSDYKKALRPHGIYISTGGAMKQTFQAMLLGPFVSMFGNKKLGGMMVKPNLDLDFMRELIESGKVKPVIDRIYKFDETAEAFEYYAKGHARGKVIITNAK